MDLPTLNCWLRRIISSMRRSVSLPDKTLRKELKLRGVFLTKFEADDGDETVCVECVTLLLKQNDFGREGGREKLRMQKMSSFSSDFQTLSKH